MEFNNNLLVKLSYLQHLILLALWIQQHQTSKFSLLKVIQQVWKELFLFSSPLLFFQSFPQLVAPVELGSLLLEAVLAHKLQD